MKRIILILSTMITGICGVAAINCELYSIGVGLLILASMFMLVKKDDHKPMRKNSIKPLN